MNVQYSPQMGDVLFLTKKEVVVVKVYTLFRLVVVHYPDETEEFCVDICALSRARLYKLNYVKPD